MINKKKNVSQNQAFKIIKFNKIKHEKCLLQLTTCDVEIKRFLNIKTGDNVVFREGCNDINLVAMMDDDSIGGFLSANITNGGRAYINQIYVFRKWRNRGIANALLAEAEYLIKINWFVSGIYALTVENLSMDNILIDHGYLYHGSYNNFIYHNGKYLTQSLFVKPINSKTT
jgi:GNAT superfamily N-acetyltransferase